MVTTAQSPNPNSGGSQDGKKEDDLDKDGEGNGVVKANKGMILRKSVEYIRWVVISFGGFFPPFYARFALLECVSKLRLHPPLHLFLVIFGCSVGCRMFRGSLGGARSRVVQIGIGC